jgi:competence protein ComEC
MLEKKPQQNLNTQNKPKKSNKKAWLWVLTVFLIISGLTFMPSFASLLFFVATILVLPIGKLQEALKNKFFPKKFIKTGLCWILVLTGIFTAPTDTTTQETPTKDAIEQIEDTQEDTQSFDGLFEELLSQDTQVDTEPIEIIEIPPLTEETPTQEPQTEPQKPVEPATPPVEAPKEETPTEETTAPVEIPTQPEEELIPENSSFEIHYIDVGQADSALVLCDGKAMLIDGGNAGDSSLIYSYLKNHNVSHLDYIIATHGHEDHVGGLSGALNYATVDTVYCSVNDYDTDAFRDFVKYLGKQGKEISIPTAGTSFKLGSASVQIIAVNGSAADHNDSSIILRIVYGETSFLFTGDAEREAEQTALNSGYELESTVLKVGHHGSKNATEYVFLRQVAPQYAVICVGEDNTYGHPTEDTLSRLRDADVKTYRTDLQGTIICVSDGTSVSFTVSKNADADTLAPTATIEQLQSIVSKSVDSYNGSSNKKLAGKLAYSVISKTEVQLTYNVSNPIYSNEEYLLDEVMDQILDYVLADISASTYANSHEVYAEITVNYEIYNEEQPTIVPEEKEPVVEGTNYVGNKNTKKFHYSWCSSVKKMKESNKYYYTGTRNEMIAKGYVPCKNCNP